MDRKEQIEQARRIIATGIVEVLQQQFPELKESVRKTLLRCCDDWDKGQFGCMKKEDVSAIRAYLERQKEPLTPEEKMNHPLYLEGFDVGKKVGEVLNLGPDETEYPYNHPANTLEGEIKNIWSKLSIDNAFVASFEGFREVILHFVNFVQKEQKPAEWSEEDEEMLSSIAECCKYGVRVSDDAIFWLKSLPERFNLQPKQEWSGEDEKTRLDTIRILETASPIPQDNGKVQLRFSKNILWLKSLRPQPGWKPSEQQMQTLKDVIDRAPLTCRQEVQLVSLYNDLKKLL